MKLKSLCLSLFVLMCLVPLVHGQGPSYPYSATVSWTLSTSTITGQNVYRAPYSAGACGTYTKLNSAALSATANSYVDLTIVPNAIYCYYTTALNGTTESGPSNVASNIVIPPAPNTGTTAVVQ
jgi:hypothetical protein